MLPYCQCRRQPITKTVRAWHVKNATFLHGQLQPVSRTGFWPCLHESDLSRISSDSPQKSLSKRTRNPPSRAFSSSQRGVGAPGCAYLARQTERTVLLIAPISWRRLTQRHDLAALRDVKATRTPVFPRPTAPFWTKTTTGNATQDRLSVLDALHRKRTRLVITTAGALAHPTLPITELIHAATNSPRLGGKLERDEFILHRRKRLRARREAEVPGQFRGSRRFD